MKRKNFYAVLCFVALFSLQGILIADEKMLDFGTAPFESCSSGTRLNSVEGKRQGKDFLRARDLIAKYIPAGVKNCKSSVCEVQGQADISYLEKYYRDIIRTKKEFLEPYGDGYIFLSKEHHFYFLSKMICLTEDEARRENEKMKKMLDEHFAKKARATRTPIGYEEENRGEIYQAPDRTWKNY